MDARIEAELATIPKDVVDPQLPQQEAAPSKKAAKPLVRPVSRFNELHASIKSAQDIATHVESSKEEMSDPKQFNLFLQAISARDAALYEDLFANFKAHVLLILKLLYSQSEAAHATKLSPFALEFILRAEANQMKRSQWIDGVTPLATPGVKGDSDLTPKQMLHELSARDAKGKCIRRVELSHDISEIEACCAKLQKGGELFDLPPPEQAIIISRLLSKARRVLFPSKDPFKDKNRKRPREDNEHSDNEDGAAEAAEVPKASFDPALIAPAISALLELTHAAFVERRGSPPGKVTSFLKWIRNYVPDADKATYKTLEDKTSNAAASEADQLEAVMELKACADDEAFHKIVERLSVDEEGSVTMKLTSPDVLSSFAVAAKKLSDESKAVAARLLAGVQTQFAKAGGSLPRRAATFLVEQRAIERRKTAGPKAAVAPPASSD